LSVHFRVIANLEQPPHQLINVGSDLDIDPFNVFRSKIPLPNQIKNGIGGGQRPSATGYS
jgi:hypothetical protein